MFVNGRPVFLAAPYPKGEEPYENGKKLRHHIPSNIYCVTTMVFPMHRNGTADISAETSVLDRFLAWKPEALFVFRTGPVAPGWWLDANPGEEMLFDRAIRDLPGYKKRGFQNRLYVGSCQGDVGTAAGSSGQKTRDTRT